MSLAAYHVNNKNDCHAVKKLWHKFVEAAIGGLPRVSRILAGRMTFISINCICADAR